VAGQVSGLIAGSVLLAFFTGIYLLLKSFDRYKSRSATRIKTMRLNLNTEISKEFDERDKKNKKD
jgi:hypothetical protein